jgi:uncharacterized protein YqgC (DUF456 family)
MTTILIILSILLFGLAALTFIPALPIVPVQFAVILLYSILSGFLFVSGWELLVFAVFAALSLLVDYSAGALGAKIGGAHRWSVLAGIIGGLLGTFFFPPFGAFVGIPLFVFASESFIKKKPSQAGKTAGLSFAGAVGGVIVNGFLAFATAILFLIFVF